MRPRDQAEAQRHELSASELADLVTRRHRLPLAVLADHYVPLGSAKREERGSSWLRGAVRLSARLLRYLGPAAHQRGRLMAKDADAQMRAGG
jgi:hypothetical protein